MVLWFWQNDGGTRTVQMQLGSDAESDVDDQEEDAGLPSLRNILEGLCRFSVYIVELDTDLRMLN